MVDQQLRTLSRDDGRFVLAAVPVGERALRIEHLGHKPLVIENIAVRAGLPTQVNAQLETAPLPIPGVSVEAQRVRLIEPDVVTTHEVVIGRELRELPVDRLQDVIELTAGVSGGHFRGGRMGQEVYLIDGLELKNQFEASAHGLGLELSPTSLEEVEVVTGGFGAQHGSALSGVVRYVTRRGRIDGWEGAATLLTDHWAPESLFRGFTGLTASAGGPTSFLGAGATLFADVLAQAMVDSEPRARGLTCLRAADADSSLAQMIQQLQTSVPGLVCPYTAHTLPHQRGEKLIGLLRFDRPLTRTTSVTLVLLRNRLQRELYTSEFRYNPMNQLGQRSTGTLGSMSLDWTRNTSGRGLHATARASLVRIDRYLGAVDPWTFDGRSGIGGLGFSNYRFLGEDFARQPIGQQLAAGDAVPGYVAPGGLLGSPFGAAAEGIFLTEGTPHIANWARSDLFAADLVGEMLGAAGGSVRTGASLKLYRVESYERILSHLPGSAPNYARFYPATVSAFTDVRIGAADEITFTAGVRLEAFRAGLTFREDRGDFLAPVAETSWRLGLMPRFGLALPLPQSDGRTALRFNFGLVAQPPDFRYFLDTSLGDSLRTDLRRQGNPNLSFERGQSYELGVSHLLGEHVGAGVTAFRKELSQLATGSLSLAPGGVQRFSTNDAGTVNGVELSVRGRWPFASLRASYALQKATGITSGSENDTTSHTPGERIELPLAFDQRHALDLALFLGRAAGSSGSPWSAALISLARSGYPRDRLAAAGDTVITGAAYLPWTWTIDLRLSRELGRLPACHGCAWRLTFDGRNLLGRDNVRALSGASGGLGPTAAEVLALARRIPPPTQPIPAESPAYLRALDTDRDGVINAQEFENARIAAALDRFDPSLYFGEARQLRLGVEVSFR